MLTMDPAALLTSLAEASVKGLLVLAATALTARLLAGSSARLRHVRTAPQYEELERRMRSMKRR